MQSAQSDFVRGMMQLSLEERSNLIDSLPRAIRRRVRYTWELWARPKQLWRPGAETHTIYLQGRRAGKTRSGAEAVRYVAAHPELCAGFIGIAGRTTNDVNNTMIDGVSGLMSTYPAGERPRWFKSSRTIEWRNGVTARLFSGEKPDSFRGPGYGFLWADELPHWQHLEESWSNAIYALSLGAKVRSVITTTPIGVETLERLVWAFDKTTDSPIAANDLTPAERVLQGYVVHPSARIITGDTYENAANLAPNYLAEIIAENEGTATADQEIRGQILRDVPTAIFRRAWVHRMEQLPDDVDQVIVVIDPSGSANASRTKTAEVGMIVMAVSVTGMVYVIEDASGRMSPEEWGARAWSLADRWGVDAIVAEENYGGQMVPATLRAARPRANIRSIVRTVSAHRDKATRASLTVPAFQSGRIVFCGDSRKFVHLDRQLFGFDPTKGSSQPSPDRMDAFVWGVLYLINGGDDRRRIRAMSDKAAWKAIAEELRRRTG